MIFLYIYYYKILYLIVNYYNIVFLMHFSWFLFIKKNLFNTFNLYIMTPILQGFGVRLKRLDSRLRSLHVDSDIIIFSKNNIQYIPQFSTFSGN